MTDQNKRQSAQRSSARPSVSSSKRVTEKQQNAARNAKAAQAKRAEQVNKTATRLGAAASATKKTIKHAASSTSQRFDAGKALDSLKEQTSESLEAAKNLRPKIGGAASGSNRTTRSVQGSSRGRHGAKTGKGTTTRSGRQSSAASGRQERQGRAAAGSSARTGRQTRGASVDARQGAQSRGGAASTRASQQRGNARTQGRPTKQRGGSMSFADNPYVQTYSGNKKGFAGSVGGNQRGQQKLRGGNPSTGSFSAGKQGGIGSLFGSLAGNFMPIVAVVALIAVLAIGAGIDGLLNKEKIYPGIKVGSVDVSGMTESEAKVAIDDAFSPGLVTKKLTVNAVPAAEGDEAPDESKSHSWTITADKMNITLPAAELAKSAYEIGREDGGALKRLSLFLGGKTIEPHVSIDNDELEAFATKIDKKVGTPRTDATVSIENGVATPVDGSDGVVVSRNELKTFIDDSYLNSTEENPAITLSVESASSRTSIDQATAMATTINNAISDGLELSYEGKGWRVDASTLGEWTKVSVVEDDRGAARLEAKLKTSTLESSILKKVVSMGKAPKSKISFDSKGGQVTVYTDGQGQIPMVEEATQVLSNLYAANDKGVADTGKQPDGAQANDGVPVKIAVQAGPIPNEMTLEKAKLCGVVQKISTYKTEYEGGDDEAARVHNIHRASDLLNNSIVKAEGGEWSFHETAGECNKENGFEAAGVVVNGQIEQDYGGGICQVATTVFNAVYEAGLPVVRRHNHSLYVAAYPDGRDAAVSWPDLDFIWQNDLSSDVLVTMGYTGGSVTCTLYGVDPNRQVSTKTGTWKKGQKYGTTNIVDTSIGSDNWYTKTYGSDGSSITVWRTVRNSKGNVIIDDTFESNYDPQNQVNVFGSQRLLNSYAKSTS